MAWSDHDPEIQDEVLRDIEHIYHRFVRWSRDANPAQKEQFKAVAEALKDAVTLLRILRTKDKNS